uniref:uncharacterized protein n=1 Tax=Myxine glutinosa TaxID=7769 RepID=UPI00358E566E
MPKRKRSVEPAAQSSPPTCILHVPSMSDHGDFTPLRKIKGSASEKLQLLQKIRDRRRNQPHDSPCRMQSVCDQIPATLPDDLERVGYHSKCYKHFVRHFHRLGDDTEPGPSTSSWHHSPRKPGGSAEPIFPPECIFCEKVETKDAHRNTERPTTFPSFKNKENAWEQIETRAEKMGLYRLHRKVKNKDLFACEAKHHPSCFKAFRTAFYNYERAIHRAEAPKEQACMSAAHEKAFNSVLEHIQTQVIQQNKVLQLSSLRLLYVEELKLNGYENSNYRSEKLLKRLQNDPIKEHIHFTKVDHDKCDVISFWLVHSSNITVSNALARAFTPGSTNKNQNVALQLRQGILQAFRECKDQPWPPTAEDMELNPEDILPPDLVRFLSVLMTGKEGIETEKVKRLVFSIGQDLCRAVSDGKWKLPKHILLCVTVRHLFRSKQLTTILHRLGHSESYDFALELETALAKVLDEVSTYRTPQIVTGEGNLVFHCEWDNLNKTTTSVHGSNIVNSAGGIMVQEVKPGFESSKDRMLPTINRSQQRSLKVDTPKTLANDDNKKQMCQLLLKVWSGQEAATRLERTEMAVLIVEGKAHQLASTNGKVEVRELPTIYSNQEETDTRVVLYLHHAATIGYKNAVVRTPDTDILLILLHHAHNIKLTVYLDTGSGKHRQLVNVSELAESLGEDYCATLLGYYVFSGEDCTSAFKGKGKVGPLKKLEKNPRFHRAFGELGDNWDANPEVERQLEKFTCVMYGQSRESSVDIVRAKLLRKMVGEDKTLTSKSKVDLARLPPCQSALKPHIQRVNHRVALYKRADQPIIEKPKPYEEQGWIRTDEGLLKPMWSSGPILPTSLVDLLNTGEHEEEEEEEGEEEFDSDDFDENDDD